MTVDFAITCDGVPDICVSPGWQREPALEVIGPGSPYLCLAVGPQIRPFTSLSLGCLGTAGSSDTFSFLLLTESWNRPATAEKAYRGGHLSPTNIQIIWEITPRGVEISLEEELVQLPSRETEAQLGEAQDMQGERADLL